MMELNTQKMEDFEGRYKYLVAFVGLAFFLIFIRLWSLHVIKGSELRQLSENNRIRLLENPADRGMFRALADLPRRIVISRQEIRRTAYYLAVRILDLHRNMSATPSQVACVLNSDLRNESLPGPVQCI